MNSKILTFLVILLAPEEFGSVDIPFIIPPPTPCVGYTIVEFGTAIDCHGDTVELTRVNGLQVYVAEQ
jgi:hypothetical protein